MKRKIQKENAILDSARKSFLQFGVAGSRMDQIAKDAGVSKATLYKYYPSKHLILKHLMTKMFTSMSEELEYPYDSSSSIESMFEEVLSLKFALMNNTTFMELIRILSVEFIKEYPFDADTLKAISEGHNSFIHWVECAQRDGKLTSQTSAIDISHWFHSLYDGMVFWPIVMNLMPPPTQKEQMRFRSVIASAFLKMFAL